MSDRDSIARVEYRPIDGFPGYRVGSDGSVWTCWKLQGGIGTRFAAMADQWKQLLQGVSDNGYCIVRLTRDRRATSFHVHDLVLTAFIGPRPNGAQACHDPDRNPQNNRLDNLRWGTPKENNADKIKHGTHQIGERNPRAKLTESHVLEIRRLAESGNDLGSIADGFSVSTTLVRLIVKRRCWKHI